ncbi:MAG: hypothetical protein L0Y58_16105 [Verrucomicrobia subdivision 3 bacterium]|nr:hypothetical protein [Limisphaerales bacterium]
MPLPSELWNTPNLVSCGVCGEKIQAAVFPANFKTITPGQAAERILVEGESSCFYHDAKKAVVPCDACGRFLCSVCDVEIDGQHLCPPCLEASRKKGTMQRLDTYRVLYDYSALMLAIVPLLCLYFVTFITAPIAIYLAILSFRRPNSILGGSRGRAWAAIIIASLQLCGWGVLIFLFASGAIKG